MKGIGNMPLIKIEKLTDANSAVIYVKMESANLILYYVLLERLNGINKKAIK